MRTQEEILNRIEERKNSDPFMFEIHDYVERLDYDNAKEYLVEGTTREEWEEDAAKLLSPEDTIKEYMPFAWDKANSRRGISACRSLSHMVAWLWLAGEDEFLAAHNNLDHYEYYGKPQLIEVCEKYGLDWEQWDDGERTND